MITRRLFRVPFAALTALGALAAPIVARAQSAFTSCTADAAACTHGFACAMTHVQSCTTFSCPNSNCAGTTCSPAVIPACQPATCTTDADCATGMVCSNASSCVPQYDAPCHVDSDCGPGFTCVPDTETECDGGGASEVGSDGAASVAPGEDSGAAGCTTPTTSSCHLDVLPCETASNCPSSLWTCVPTPVSRTFMESAAPVEGGSVGYTVDAGPMPAMECAPPYIYLTETSHIEIYGLGGSDPADGEPLSTHASGGCQLAAAAGTDAAGGGAALFALVGFVGLVRRRRS